MQDQFDFFQEENQENQNNFLETVFKYLPYWKWFVISGGISLFVCYTYLRYSTPIYKADSKIVVKDEKKGSLPSELSAFSDIGLLSGMKNNVDNEVEVINSTTLFENVIQKLLFNIKYYKKGNIRDVELYKKTLPIKVVLQNTNIVENSSFSFTVKVVSNSQFELVDASNSSKGIFIFGQWITISKMRFKIVPSKYYFSNRAVNESYKIVIDPVRSEAAAYKKNFTIEALSKTSSIVNLSITNAVPGKAEDFLDVLVQLYNQDAINDKNAISINTQNFIQERLEIISKELGNVEFKSENYKKSKNITELQANAQLYLVNNSTIEKGLIELNTQLKIVDMMMNFMTNKKKGDLIPIDIVPKEKMNAQPNPLIIQYNSLVLQRNRIIKDGTNKNTVLVNLEEQLERLDQNIKESIDQTKSSLLVTRNDLQKQDNILNEKLDQIPSQEREFRILDRQQKIKEGIYLYLIQKREEIAISLTVAEPNAKVIDSGRAEDIAISPKKNISYLIALLVGLGIPFGILSLILLLDNKINSVKDVANLKDSLPVLAEIPLIVEQNEKKLAAESFNALVSNCNFMLSNGKNDSGHVILVSSSKKGEGKSFVSYNLAKSYSKLDKKTILIGVDLRNPQLHKYLSNDVKKDEGLTSYLAEKEKDWKSLVKQAQEEDHTLDVLLTGVIPPNPTLLLTSSRFAQLINELKKEYDYIILDSAPTLLVSDSLFISKFANLTLFIVKCGFTEKKLLQYIYGLLESKKVNNLGLVMNQTSLNKGYGYGYGYGYNYGYNYGYGADNEKQTLYQRFKSKFSFFKSN